MDEPRDGVIHPPSEEFLVAKFGVHRKILQEKSIFPFYIIQLVVGLRRSGSTVG